MNELKNRSLKRVKIGESFGAIGGLERSYFLEKPTGFNSDLVPQVKALNQVLEYYEDYINDMKKILDIWDKMKTVVYINAGFHDEDGWKHNKHFVIINGISFEYKTGTGIKLKNNYYSLYKLIFDAICCVLDEANMADYYTNMDEFLCETGYTENIKQIRKGGSAYRHMQQNKEKALEIWSREDIKNIREYIEL